jgi:hypothetical protein
MEAFFMICFISNTNTGCKFISILHFEINISWCILKKLRYNNWQKLLEFFFQTNAYLCYSIHKSCSLWIRICYSSWSHSFNNNLTDYDCVCFANFRLIFNWSKNKSDAFNAVSSELLLLLGLPFNCTKNIYKSRHEFRIMYLKTLIHDTSYTA